jgi:hypothetical protein
MRPRARAFDAVWDELADAGKVDQRGGAEYTRTFDAWLEAGCPLENLTAWIYAEANKYNHG